MSNLYSEKPPEPQRLNLSSHITNNLALAAAQDAFGRHWCPPAMRDFQDATPAESLAARKAARFSNNHIPADAFARACRELGWAA